MSGFALLFVCFNKPYSCCWVLCFPYRKIYWKQSHSYKLLNLLLHLFKKKKNTSSFFSLHVVFVLDPQWEPYRVILLFKQSSSKLWQLLLSLFLLSSPLFFICKPKKAENGYNIQKMGKPRNTLPSPHSQATGSSNQRAKLYLPSLSQQAPPVLG